jgi:hypothetical protein
LLNGTVNTHLQALGVYLNAIKGGFKACTIRVSFLDEITKLHKARKYHIKIILHVKQVRNRTQSGRKDPSVYNRKYLKKWYSCINIFHINHHLKCILNARNNIQFWLRNVHRTNKIAVFTDTNNSATFMNLGQNEHIFTNIWNLKKEMKRLTSLINQ